MSETVRDPVANPWHGPQAHGANPHVVRSAWRQGQIGGLASASKAVSGGKLSQAEQDAASGLLSALAALLAEPDNSHIVHLLAGIMERQAMTSAT